ncbi:hypothetical protein EL26_09395 [Tumebacillus flagellatus]|uniref:Uncharacterized protein n=2 Tax=Tumebacillus flagellatus TaxID=1157490 RepID=A0A074LNC9_9BACL|nr:hypothetical protein EL26_09395 [Tumebacillus flagellatus]
MYEVKQRAIEWQGKRLRLKRTVTGAALMIAAVLSVVIYKATAGQDIRWSVVIGLFAVGLVVCVGSLMAYANTMLVAMYYAAYARLLEAPEELDLVTGTLEEVSRVQMPYIGMLYQVTVSVAGESYRYYCPGKLLQGVYPQERIRLRTHDLFAIRVDRV